MAEAAGAAVDQDPPAGLKVRDVDQAVPRRQAHQWQRGGVHVVEVDRFAGELPRRHGHEFGVSPAFAGKERHPVNLVAHVESGDARNDLLDHPGDVPAEDERRRTDQRQGPRPGHRVDGVHGAGVHTHEHLGRDENRPVDVGNFENIRTAEGPLGNCAHQSLDSPLGLRR